MTNMRYLSGFILAFAFLAAGCSKDKAETKPTIKVKSLSSTNIPVNSDLAITLDFTDKEADLESIFIQKIRQNIRTTTTIRDSFSLPVADFPKRQDGEMEIRLFYQLQLL